MNLEQQWRRMPRPQTGLYLGDVHCTWQPETLYMGLLLAGTHQELASITSYMIIEETYLFIENSWAK